MDERTEVFLEAVDKAGVPVYVPIAVKAVGSGEAWMNMGESVTIPPLPENGTFTVSIRSHPGR